MGEDDEIEFSRHSEGVDDGFGGTRMVEMVKARVVTDDGSRRGDFVSTGATEDAAARRALWNALKAARSEVAQLATHEADIDRALDKVGIVATEREHPLSTFGRVQLVLAQLARVSKLADEAELLQDQLDAATSHHQQTLRDNTKREAAAKAKLDDVTAKRDEVGKMAADAVVRADKAERELAAERSDEPYCGYCSETFPADWEALQEHIKVCPEHPLTAALAKLDAVTAERDSLAGIVEVIEKALASHYKAAATAWADSAKKIREQAADGG